MDGARGTVRRNAHSAGVGNAGIPAPVCGITRSMTGCGSGMFRNRLSHRRNRPPGTQKTPPGGTDGRISHGGTGRDYARWDDLLENGGFRSDLGRRRQYESVQGRIVANRRILTELCGDGMRPPFWEREEPREMPNDLWQNRMPSGRRRGIRWRSTAPIQPTCGVRSRRQGFLWEC